MTDNKPDARTEVLLSMWGKWVIRSMSGGLGYGNMCPMFRMLMSPSGDSYGSHVPAGTCDSNDMAAIDEAVRRLKSVYYLAVIEFYVNGGNMNSVAKRMGTKRDAVQRYLNNAIYQIYLDLNRKDRV